jgi:hypothetical protein
MGLAWIYFEVRFVALRSTHAHGSVGEMGNLGKGFENFDFPLSQIVRFKVAH